MATRWAVATGNWSNTATWDGGTLPTAADDVYADGKTVTIDQNVTVLTLRTTQRAGGTNGGGFTVSGAYTIAATNGIICGTASTALTCTNTTGTTVTVNAALIGGTSNSNQTVLFMSGTGTLNITGNISYAASAGGGNGLLRVDGAGATVSVTGTVVGNSINNAMNAISMNGSGATLTVTGNVTGPSGNANNQQTINIAAAAGSLTIVGDVTGGSGSGNTTYAINIAAGSSIVSITGNVTGGSTTNSHAVNRAASSAAMTVIGTITGGTGDAAHGISDASTSGYLAAGGSLIDRTNSGTTAIYARKFRCISTLNTTRQHANNAGFPAGAAIVYGSLDYIPNNIPVPANVRSGTIYGNNSYTGTCAVPAAASVAYGVPVDNTTGTAALTPAAVWDHLTSNITTAGSIGERVKNTATVATTGDQLAAVFP